jgi:hypothetical protein
MTNFQKALLISISAAVLATTPSATRAQEKPNFDLAYKLATASYCAYAVEEIEPEYGRARAAACLRLAAKSDPRLNSLDVDDAKIDAFAADKDAYLLVDSADGVILAFRGTLAPSLALSSKSLQEYAGRVFFDNNSKLRDEVMTFVRDWVNDALIGVDSEGRHLGFYDSWKVLRAHLEKATCPDGSRNDCSNSASFFPSSGARKKLFITGHSKGGAVALMAALDPSKVFANAEKPVVYTFASAKGLDFSVAKNIGEVGRAIWRFEQEGDVVPSLPTDKTPFSVFGRAICGLSSLIQLDGKRFACYAHVGPRAVFKADGQLDFPGEPQDGVDPRGDVSRLGEALAGAAADGVTKILAGDGDFIARIATSSDSVCRLFIDRHFAVFSAVQKYVWASDSNRPAGKDFFAAGVGESGAPTLWGYTKWCDLVMGKN